jgi:general secretion pathway protein A
VNPCRQAERLGLRCKTGRGGLAEVRNANRPAVLRVHDAQGKPFEVALTELDDRTATFVVGGGTTVVALDSLAAQWSGDYTLLWRVPPDNREVILPDSRGPAVAWLVTQLAQVQGEKVDATTDARFDDAVAQRVKQFQLAQGLMPDGAIGPQTLIRLSALTDQSAPKLIRR